MTDKVNIDEAKDLQLSEVATLKKEVSNLKLQLESYKDRLSKSRDKVVEGKSQIARFERKLKSLLNNIDRVHHKSPKSEIEDIQETVCAYFGIGLESLTGTCREKRYIEARHIAMYLCRQQKISYPEIGNAFGNRDHTSIIHAVKKVETNKDLKQLAGEIGK